MKRQFRAERGGFIHLTVAAALLAGVAAAGLFGQSLNDLIAGKSGPGKIALSSDASARCAADTIDTIAGTIGCGSAKAGTRLTGLTFLSATKKN